MHLLLPATLLAGRHQTSSIAGQVVGWGRNVESQASPPAGLSNVIAVAAAGDVKSLALRSDGTVTAWGDWTHQPCGLSNAVAIASGQRQNVALLANVTVVDWSWDYLGQPVLKPAPSCLSNVVKVASGMAHNLALRSNGTEVAWSGLGAYPNGESIPDGEQMCQRAQAMWLTWRQGLITAWRYGQMALLLREGHYLQHETNMPTGLSNVVAITAGEFHGLALVGSGPPGRQIN